MTGGLLAHGIGGRQDLPIPYGLALLAAGTAVLVSFLVSLLLRRELATSSGRPVPRAWGRLVDSPRAAAVGSWCGLAVWLGVVVAAVTGGQDVVHNIAPTFLYVLVWLGLVAGSLLLGPWYAAVNPARGLHRAFCALAGMDRSHGVRELALRQSAWPATAQLLVFAWVELCLVRPSDPSVVAYFLVGQLAVNLMGALVYGDGWFAVGDGFEVWSRLVARLSWWSRDDEGRAVVRSPLASLTRGPSRPGLSFLVCAVIATTSFDGFSRTQFFYTHSGGVLDEAGWKRLGFMTAGLVLLVTVLALAVWAATAVTARVSGVDPERLAERMALALVPIGIGYMVAHYFSLAVFQGQDLLRLVSDPAGQGWDLFGTRGRRIDYTALSAATIAVVQVLGVATGHVVSVFAGHEVALAELPERKRLLAQLPYVVLMVALTVTALVILLNG